MSSWLLRLRDYKGKTAFARRTRRSGDGQGRRREAEKSAEDLKAYFAAKQKLGKRTSRKFGSQAA